MALKAHIDTNPSRIEGRRQPRRSLRLETSGVLPGGLDANVTVHNISAAGLLIETAQQMVVGEVLAIELPNAGPVGVEVVWQSGQLYGCAFEQALGEAALAAAQLRGTAATATTAQGRVPVIGKPPGDTLGARLNRLRRERGLTLAQVAYALDVSKPTVWAWEKGKARPLPERLGVIAQVLGVREEELADTKTGGSAAALVEDCRRRLAEAWAIDPQSIRIMIEV